MKSSFNLPTSQIYKPDGTYKNKDELTGIATNIVGKGMTKEIITYCDTGKVCLPWSFLLTELMGYENVTI